MKKIFAVLLVLVALFALSGCGEKGTCEMCSTQDVSLEEVELGGETVKLCEDCADIMDELGNLAGEWG